MTKLMVLFMLVLSQVIYGQNISNPVNEIKSVLLNQQIAWNEGNIEAFMSGYWQSDSLTFIGSKGLTYGWDNTLNNYKKSYPDTATMGKLRFEIIKLDILSDDAAILIGRYVLTREKDQPTGLFTLIWKKINDKWLIVADQTCG